MPNRMISNPRYPNPRYLEDLRRAFNERRLVLFLGAGVSLPYNIPTWKDLVTEILISRPDEGFDFYYPAYRTALASWLSEKYGFSPTLVARAIRSQIDNDERLSGVNRTKYKHVVRDALYKTYNRDVQKETALASIVRIIEANEEADRKRAFPAVVTFNFDDLLEQMLREKNVPTKSVYKDSRIRGKNFPVIHVNGYLPEHGSKLDSELVFTEDEFNMLTFSQLNWAVSELTNYLRNYTVLFIGLSMSDTNLRRLLDGTCSRRKKPSHYLLRGTYRLSPGEVEKARIQIEDNASNYRSRVGEGEMKSTISLDMAIERIVQQAHEYDERLFNDMGVGTLWLEDFDEIPQILDCITRT